MGELKLFTLTQAAMDYGVTFAVLVAAHTEDQARLIVGRDQRSKGSSAAFDWIDPEITTAQHIGYGTPGLEPGVIMTKESAS